jgi:hypothetical protein
MSLKVERLDGDDSSARTEVFSSCWAWSLPPAGLEGGITGLDCG